MARVLVIGAGAIGGAVAGRLLAAHHDVELASRQLFSRLELQAPDTQLSRPVRVRTEPEALEDLDWLLLCTKAHQVAAAAPWLRKQHSSIPVAVLQNGVEHAERVLAVAGERSVLPVIVEGAASRTAPGIIQQRRPGRLTVPATELGRAFAALEGLAVEAASDFTTAAWQKLCVNAPGGAVAALTGRAVNVTREPEVGRFARALLDECLAVGRAEGARLDVSLREQILANMRQAPDTAITSMGADRAAGRELEVDARNGAVVRFGNKHGIPTPNNRLVTALLGQVNRSQGELGVRSDA